MAEAIRQAILNESAFAMRYGGDEFLLISETDLSERIEGRVKALPCWSAFPAEPLLSCGSYEVTAKDRLLMAEAIKVADMRIYEEKKIRNWVGPSGAFDRLGPFPRKAPDSTGAKLTRAQ